MSNPTPNPKAAARAAVLAATEARLRPPPPYDAGVSTEDQIASSSGNGTGGSSSGSSPARPQGAGGLFGNGNATLARPDGYKPTEKDDRETRVRFGRLLDRGIIRDNGYKQSAEAVETLLKIATNILQSDDPKYRSLKSSNTLLKTKVLAVRGGQDYLIALGFRTQTVDFTQHFVFSSTLKKRHELEIGVDVLREHVKSLQDRVALTNVSATAHASAEAARRAIALREIEADRDTVKVRAERERLARAARDAVEREKAEKAAAEEAEQVVDQVDEERREMAEAVVRPQASDSARRVATATAVAADQNMEVEGGEADAGAEAEEQEQEEGGEGDEVGEEDDELPSYAEDRASRRWGGPGRRLGA